MYGSSVYRSNLLEYNFSWPKIFPTKKRTCVGGLIQFHPYTLPMTCGVGVQDSTGTVCLSRSLQRLQEGQGQRSCGQAGASEGHNYCHCAGGGGWREGQSPVAGKGGWGGGNDFFYL